MFRRKRKQFPQCMFILRHFDQLFDFSQFQISVPFSKSKKIKTQMVRHLQNPRFFMFFISKYRSLFQIADKYFLKDVLCIMSVSNLNINCAVKHIPILVYHLINPFIFHKVILLFHLIHAPEVQKVTQILFFSSLFFFGYFFIYLRFIFYLFSVIIWV